jgi:hypothetical protein
MQCRLVGEDLTTRSEVYGRCDRSEDLIELSSQRAGIGRIDHAAHTIDGKAVPLDGGRGVTRMKPPYHAVEPRKRS